MEYGVQIASSDGASSVHCSYLHTSSLPSGHCSHTPQSPSRSAGDPRENQSDADAPAPAALSESAAQPAPPGMAEGREPGAHAATTPASAPNAVSAPAPPSGQSVLSLRPHDQSRPSQERARPSQDTLREPGSKDRSKSNGRRPSQQRVCGKCHRHLTGQFVRALGDTYHLFVLHCATKALGLTVLQRVLHVPCMQYCNMHVFPSPN